METNYTRTKETLHTMTAREWRTREKKTTQRFDRVSTDSGYVYTAASHKDKSMIEMNSAEKRGKKLK